jgi:gamma-glutamylcyclotransferase (GGCT)/AIG2-like uncharacterized protein YtfP
MNFFVYGSLKAGFWNYDRLDMGNRARLIGKAVTARPDYLLYDVGFPLAINVDGWDRPADERHAAHITGELYEMTDPSLLRDLDRLEGNGSMYQRYVRSFDLEGQDEPVEASIYEYISSPKRIGENNGRYIGGVSAGQTVTWRGDSA